MRSVAAVVAELRRGLAGARVGDGFLSVLRLPASWDPEGDLCETELDLPGIDCPFSLRFRARIRDGIVEIEAVLQFAVDPDLLLTTDWQPVGADLSAHLRRTLDAVERILQHYVAFDEVREFVPFRRMEA